MGNFDFLIENGEQDLYILANIAEKLYSQENYLSAGNIIRQFLESAICGFAEYYGMEIERNKKSGDICSLSSTIDTLFDVYMNKNTFTKLKTTCDSLRWFGNNCSHYKPGRYDKEKSEVLEQLRHMHYVAKWYIFILYDSKDILNEKYNLPEFSFFEQDYKELQSCYNNEIDSKKKIEEQLQSLQESYSNLKVNYDKLCENNLAIEELNKQYDDLEVLYNKTVSELHNATSENNELHQEICNLKTSMEQLLAKFERLNTRNEILERDNAELKAKVAQIDNNIPEIIQESTNELELNIELNTQNDEEFNDVLNVIRLFNKKHIKYINFETITHFLMGNYTNQISSFKLNLEEGYGKYKENGIRNLNNILLQIAELGIIKYPLGDIEYYQDKDIFLIEEYHIVKTRLFNNYKNKNIENLNEIENIYRENIYDYLFLRTINYLFEKYSDKCPIVVQKSCWTSNYYFIVEKIENDMAIGKIYCNDRFEKEEVYSANAPFFRLYDRLDLSKTIKPEILAEIYPPNLLDYTRLHTIEYLFYKYKNNKVIKVQRNSWHSGYYFLVEHISENLAFGKTKNGIEKCYPANDATFSLYP